MATDVTDHPRVLLTGGAGRLGTELRSHLVDVVAPPRRELDVTRADDIVAWIDRTEPDVLVHAAAWTDVAGAGGEREACWRTNVDGTRHVAEAARARSVRLVHISTDYVFDGCRGQYAEDDRRGPVRNYYALTKLAAETLARLAPDHLIIRTSFRPRVWVHPVAFDDLYTSQDYVDVIAPEIAEAIRHAEEIPHDTLHIATERKSVYELARRRRRDVERGSRSDASVALPEDVSLDVSRWQDVRTRWSRA